MIRALGHLGLWAGLYALAALICFAQLAGLIHSTFPVPRWEAIGCVLLTATAIYAIDRVKIRRRWLDPADAISQPHRYAFLHSVDRRTRVAAGLMFLLAGAIGLRLAWYIPFAVLVSAIGGVVYAPTPRRGNPRLKDRLWIKNAYAAVGMTAFVAVVALASGSNPGSLWSVIAAQPLSLAFASAIVACRIFFDAALCDIDDEHADRQFRTDTFAIALGPTRVWNWTGIGRLVMTVLLAFLTVLPLRARVCWCVAMLLGMVVLRWRRPDRIRDAIDVRFLPEAVLATAALVAWRAIQGA